MRAITLGAVAKVKPASPFRSFMDTEAFSANWRLYVATMKDAATGVSKEPEMDVKKFMYDHDIQLQPELKHRLR